MAYPASIDSFTSPQGTTLQATDDHASQHRNLGSAVVNIETVLGTTPASSLFVNFAAGDKPIRVNSGGTIQSVLAKGTANNMTFGTANLIGGSAANMTLGTTNLIGGTATNLVTVTPTIGTPVINVGSDATGDIYYRNVGAFTRLPIGSLGQYLTSNGTVPSWGTVASVATDGWTAANESWTMLGTANQLGTITVPATAGTRFEKGLKIKFTQGGSVLYQYVKDIPSGTTVLVTSGTNYPLGTGPITNNYYSRVSSPDGFPYSMSYVPTYTNSGTITPSAQSFRISDGVCEIQVGADLINSNSGTIQFTGPINSGTNPFGYWYGLIGVFDNGAWQASPGVYGVLSGTSTISIGKAVSTFGANAFAGFTTSGNKAFQGPIRYHL